MKNIIRTVKEDIPPEPWGFTNAHSHLNCSLSEEFSDHALYNDYAGGDANYLYEDTFEDFTQFSKSGGFALVDTTPIGLSRNPSNLLDASVKTNTNIVAATGIYHEPFIPKVISEKNQKEITEHFIKEINLGIGDTNIKAGIIKIATYKGPITDLEKRIFRAAASASIETGTSITTHTYLGKNALEQVDLLVANGVKPDKIVIGHLDDNKINLNLIRNIIDKGSYAQFDAIGCEYYSKRLNSQMPSDNERISAIKQLRADGLIDRIMIGSDLCLKKHLKKNGGPGYEHLVKKFLFNCLDRGLSESIMNNILILNPSKILTIS